ncbi:3-isopropylmalate dehydratase small subunit [Streptomyces sp. SID8382]|uniref:3-isopropylmalate dehydratase small subunit n=1 Tax=Streptomyces malaysiensis TaxID=92644 RepID=UPI000C2B734F|nr:MULTISPECIES: 3-isopropylmalate dehydratase small subunit [unclassified Streptomyces]AUA08226.1 3-isopropylmalate dehydratase small subunit 1 [Streptomyces sp. M56]MYX62541.1 3-isopropylmalate dehydratase small subunit [Streptomyces sp. SID8382]
MVKSSSSRPEIRVVTGPALVLRGNDIDTDRIIPARFLKHLTFDRLGEHVFEDDRKEAAASGAVHPFDAAESAGAAILLTAKNFGCGSSREHAPQALYRWGIQAVVGESFGEIFRGNCTTIGLPCVVIAPEHATEACALAESSPATRAVLDLERSDLRMGDRSWPIQLPESVRDRFVTGRWDTLAELHSAARSVRAVADRLPYLNGWTVGAHA